ncbi:ABC transporter permease [Acetoanaerobium pronyense]|nr:ABC transporter permease [Acetoanaerobium pronyense]
MYKELFRFSYVLKNFIRQELTVKYKRSFFGLLWSLLNPILTMSISAIVFGSIMRFKIEDFAVFIFSGLLPFNYFGGTVQSATMSLIGSEGFIKKIYIPKILFPVSLVVSNFVNLLFSMTALFFIMLFINIELNLALFFLPLSFFILFIFTLGISLIFSIVNVFFRDFTYLIGVFLTGLYYLTPILYPLDYIRDTPLYGIVIYNPITYIIDMFRYPLYLREFPPLEITLTAIAISVISFIVGNQVFKKYEKEIVFYL